MIRRVFSVLICLCVLWLAGAFYFISIIPLDIPSSENKTEAIVVLTGGPQRIGVGLDLLNAEAAQKLLISGVHSDVTLADITGSRTVDAQKISLGRRAKNTYENAIETAQWAEETEISYIRIVTDASHLPRTLLMFHATAPKLRLLAHPVDTTAVSIYSIETIERNAPKLIKAYHKYILARIGVWLGQFDPAP